MTAQALFLWCRVQASLEGIPFYACGLSFALLLAVTQRTDKKEQ